MRLKNKYFLLRHGESFSNVKEVISSWPEQGRFPLTPKGEQDIKKAAQELKDKDIDFIFSSDLLRTKQTAEIVSEETGTEVDYEKRIREYDAGDLNGKPSAEWRKIFKKGDSKFEVAPLGGENYQQVKERVADFFYEIEDKFSGKNILIISHQTPLALIEAVAKGISTQGIASLREIAGKMKGGQRMKTGELREINN
jgi:broad specificity phosphatase PhoE